MTALDAVGSSPRLHGLKNQLGTVTGSYVDGQGLPPECYVDEEIFGLERNAIFMQEWLCVGRADQIPEVGDFFTVTLMGEALIVVRDADLSVRVMSAICRHRGMVITGAGDGERDQWLQEQPETSGNAAKGFRCPYHFWVYGTDGRLSGAPQMVRTPCFDRNSADLSLPSLRTEMWQGFVFVNFSADAPPLAERLGGVDAIIGNWKLESMVTEDPSLLSNQPWNWKIMHQNSIDVYHVDRLHYPRHAVLPASGFLPMDVETGDAAIVFAQLASHPDFALSPIGKPLFPVIDTLNEEERGRSYIVLLPPSLLLILNSDSAFYRLVYPRSAGVIDIRQTLMVPAGYRELDNYGDLVSIGAEMHMRLNYQDYMVDSAIQRASTSMFAPRGPYAWNEGAVAEFDNWVARRYRSALGVAPALSGSPSGQDGPTSA